VLDNGGEVCGALEDVEEGVETGIGDLVDAGGDEVWRGHGDGEGGYVGELMGEGVVEMGKAGEGSG
jgi:hypothetical protein